MKLDKRIIEGKKPLTCFDTEQAKEFLGKECYFSNCKVYYKNLSAFEKFESLTDYCIGTLTAIMHLGDRVFCVDQQCKEFMYCLPCEWVKEPEKKYRPYNNTKELFDDIGVYIGDTIHFRSKFNQTEYHALIAFYSTQKDGVETLTFGGFSMHRYTMQELFDLFELRSRGGWIPFGVEIKDGE